MRSYRLDHLLETQTGKCWNQPLDLGHPVQAGSLLSLARLVRYPLACLLARPSTTEGNLPVKLEIKRQAAG